MQRTNKIQILCMEVAVSRRWVGDTVLTFNFSTSRLRSGFDGPADIIIGIEHGACYFYRIRSSFSFKRRLKLQGAKIQCRPLGEASEAPALGLAPGASRLSR